MARGYVAIVLHAHLPFVRHPEAPSYLEEEWFFEAITETYIPLLEMMDSLECDGVDWRFTMSVTPTLAGMFSDELLQQRYLRHKDQTTILPAVTSPYDGDTGRGQALGCVKIIRVI